MGRAGNGPPFFVPLWDGKSWKSHQSTKLANSPGTWLRVNELPKSFETWPGSCFAFTFIKAPTTQGVFPFITNQ
jgi:hypothetical protein